MDKAIQHADKAIARLIPVLIEAGIPITIEKVQALIWKEIVVAYKTGAADSQRKETPNETN